MLIERASVPGHGIGTLLCIPVIKGAIWTWPWASTAGIGVAPRREPDLSTPRSRLPYKAIAGKAPRAAARRFPSGAQRGGAGTEGNDVRPLLVLSY